jgi:phage terminase large subunit-like protein
VTTLATKPSTPRLSEAARHVVIPPGIVTTAWPRVVAQCEDMGVTFDPWQHGIGAAALGKRADGKYAATVGGIVLSIPRQVGKTFLVGMIVIALCVLFPGLTVLWTAHRTRTATKTFQSLKAMTTRKKIKPHMLEPRNTNGEQEIRFRNGSTIMFGAREQGFGRGFDEVDVEVFDEAQILTEKALEDIVPAANQSRQPSGALLFFMGTPPRPGDPGEEFTNRRNKALSGKADNMLYVELSADADADPDDRRQWAKANPSFPIHTPVESMERMRENLTDDASYMREALGVWDAKGGSQVIDPTTWSLVSDPASMAIDHLALAVDIAPDRSVASVALAGQRADGLWHIELDEHRNGVGWVIPWVVARCERNQIRAVVVDGGRSPAASLVDDFEKAGVKVTTTSAADMSSACARFFDGAMEQSFRHTDQPQVNVSLSTASKRPIGDAWGWNRKGEASDITPIVAVTLALWGAQNSKVNKPTRKSRGERRAVVM